VNTYVQAGIIAKRRK